MQSYSNQSNTGSSCLFVCFFCDGVIWLMIKDQFIFQTGLKKLIWWFVSKVKMYVKDLQNEKKRHNESYEI